MEINEGDTPGRGCMTALWGGEAGWLFPWQCKWAKASSAQLMQKHSLIIALPCSFLSPLHTNPISSLRKKASDFFSSVSSNIYQSNWLLKELLALYREWIKFWFPLAGCNPRILVIKRVAGKAIMWAMTGMEKAREITGPLNRHL